MIDADLRPRPGFLRKLVPPFGAAAYRHKAGVRGGLPRVLLAAVPLFGSDLMASLAAVAVHAARRPYRWQSPRPRPAGAESNR